MDNTSANKKYEIRYICENFRQVDHAILVPSSWLKRLNKCLNWRSLKLIYSSKNCHEAEMNKSWWLNLQQEMKALYFLKIKDEETDDQ